MLKPISFLGLLVAFRLSAMTVSVTPSVPSPAPLGTPVTFSTTVSGAATGTLAYSFRVRTSTGAYHMVLDFGPKPSLTWTTIQQEGAYQMEVSVRNNTTNETVSASTPFSFTPLVVDKAPVVSPTTHPLVFVYSAPPCASGSRMRVEFQSPAGVIQDTPWHACAPGYSTNFYLAGLLATSQYAVHQILDTGTAITNGPQISFTTPAVSVQPPSVNLLTPTRLRAANGVLLQSIIGGNSIATDLAGNLLWYSPADISFVTRPQNGGTFLAIFQDQTKDPSYQFFREFDLAGNTIAETNAARVSEQLAAMGMHAVTSFSHEARKIAGGGYLVLAASERILTDVQGAGPVDVLGDTIVVLNSNLQVQWAWDAFDHLDTTRMAILGETCTAPNPGCPNWYMAKTANDWLHGNSLQLTPDGNILYSSRHQDWLIKIDYEDGLGTGEVLWRLGPNGDFQISSTDPSPWFSHQHDANFEADNTTITLFDDGNTRIVNDPAGHSRGQVLQLHERNRTANLTLNADVGSYSSAVGSAQRLPDGNYHFDSGFILDSQGNLSSQSVELGRDGSMMFGIGFAALEYRSFRMQDLYTAP